MALGDAPVWGALPAAAAMVAAACDVPARPDSWHSPGDPDPDPAQGATAALIEDERERRRALEPEPGTLTIRLDRQPRYLNPLGSPSVWARRITQGTVFEPLFRYGPPARDSESPALEPRLARSLEVSDDGRVVTIELREGVRFHDGAEFSAADAVYSLELARTGYGATDRFRADLTEVTAVTGRGEYEVEIRLGRPNAFSLRALAEVPMIPRHVYAGELRRERGREIGTGPYEVVSRSGDGAEGEEESGAENGAEGGVEDEEGVLLRRFDDYWGEEPAIETIHFRYVPDAARALVLARRGALDILPSLSATHAAEAREPHGLPELEPLELRPPDLVFLAMNARAGALRDPDVRRAVSLAIDRRVLLDEFWDGAAAPAPGPVWPGGPVHGPPVPPAHHDPAAARRVLDDAGWEVGGQGYRERDGETLRVSLLSPERNNGPLRGHIADDLRAAGILVTPREPAPSVALSEAVRRGDFDLALVEWRGEVDRNPAVLLQAAHSPRGGDVDAAVDRLRRALSPEERARASGELARAFAAEVPWAPLARAAPQGVVSSRVRGLRVWNGWFDLTALDVRDAPARDARGAWLRRLGMIDGDAHGAPATRPGPE